MWQCPNCGEQHDDVFDVCWKCGSDPAGHIDPDFEISEPVREEGQTSDSSADDTPLPSLQLPAVPYFSIPPYTWICLIMMFKDFEHLVAHGRPDLSLSPLEVALGCIGAVLLGIPIFFTMVRAMVLWIMGQQNRSSGLTEILWLLSMFRLPESIRHSYGWFVPVYYVSLGAYLIAPFAFTAWVLVQLAWQLLPSIMLHVGRHSVP